jgi:hypothetical protein
LQASAEKPQFTLPRLDLAGLALCAEARNWIKASESDSSANCSITSALDTSAAVVAAKIAKDFIFAELE